MELLRGYVLIEFESVRLLFVHVCQFEGNLHDVTLGSVVRFVLVIVDDVHCAVFQTGRHVLEVIEVEWVAEDIVAVAALQRVDVLLLLPFQLFQLLFRA